MKQTMKLLALVLACLMLVTTFVACGTPVETDSETQGNNKETNAPETQDGTGGRYDSSFNRNSVQDDIPTDLRFDGETVTFFVRSDKDLWALEMDVDTVMNDTLYDSIYYRNKTVEERLGITITTHGELGTYAKRAEWNDTLRTAVNTQTGDFDTAAIYLSTGSVLAVEGMYYNVIDFPNINLEKPWWNQSIQDELTLFSTLYYLAGDIAVTETTEAFCFLFNKNLFDKYYGAQNIDLYNVVDKKEWTMDYLYNLVAPIHEDNDGDGTISDGDLVGFVAHDPDSQDSWNDAWIVACGINITTMVNGVPELSFYSERTLRAHEAVKRLSVTCPGTMCLPSRQVTNFESGLQMFTRSNLNGGSGLREMKDTYGVLPYPMLDKEQGEYATTVSNTASLITILSSLPDSRKELVGATLELMAAESYKQVTPAYFEVAVKTKYSEAPEDAKMYDLILNSIKFSFGYCYSTESLKGGKGGLPIGALFRIINDDLAQKYDENDEVYEENLQKLIDGLDEAAYRAMVG